MAGQLVEPRRHVAALAPRFELGQRGGQRDRRLQRRLARASAVEVAAGAQDELLAGEQGVAAAEHRGEPFLRHAQRDPLGPRQLARGLPLALGDLLAAAVADTEHARARRVGIGEPRLGGRHAMAGDRPVEQRERVGREALAVQAPRVRSSHSSAASSEPSGVASTTVARVTSTAAGPLFGLPRPRHPAPLARRVEAADHQDPLHVVAREPAHDVAAGIRPEAAGELPLREAEAGQGGETTRRRAPAKSAAASSAARTSKACAGRPGCRSRRGGRSA